MGGGGREEWQPMTCSAKDALLPYITVHSPPLTDKGPALPDPPNPPNRAEASSFFLCSSGVGCWATLAWAVLSWGKERRPKGEGSRGDDKEQSVSLCTEQVLLQPLLLALLPTLQLPHSQLFLCPGFHFHYHHLYQSQHCWRAQCQ